VAYSEHDDLKSSDPVTEIKRSSAISRCPRDRQIGGKRRRRRRKEEEEEEKKKKKKKKIDVAI